MWTGAGSLPKWDDIQNDAPRGYYVEHVPEPTALATMAIAVTFMSRRRGASRRTS